MSFPVSSEHAVTASAALDAPRTFRNSRRLTPGLLLSLIAVPLFASVAGPPLAACSRCSMSVVAVGAVVARLLAIGDRGVAGRRLLLGVSRRLETFLHAVAIHVTANAPAHVQARKLVNAIHVLDLPVTRLAGHTGVDVARMREVDVFRKLVDAHPRNGLRVRTHPHT